MVEAAAQRRQIGAGLVTIPEVEMSTDQVADCRRAMAQGGAIRAQALQRLVALSNAGGTGGERAVEALLDAAEQAADAASASDVETQLAGMGLAELGAALRDLSSEDVDQRWRALARIDAGGHPRAMAALKRAARDPVARVRREAARSLGAALDALPVLVSLLDDRDFYVRQHALDAVRELLTLPAKRLWRRDRREGGQADVVWPTLLNHVRIGLAESGLGADETLEEMVSVLALWDLEEIREVAREACAVGCAPPQLVYLLVSSGESADLDALMQATVGPDGAPRMSVLNALAQTPRGISDAVTHALLTRAQALDEPYMTARAACLLTAALLGERDAATLATVVFRDAWQVDPGGVVPRRLLDVLLLCGGEAPAEAEAMIAEALRSDSPRTRATAMVASWGVLRDEKHRDDVVSFLTGSPQGPGRDAYDAFVGMNEDSRLLGMACLSAARVGDAGLADAVRNVVLHRAVDALGWSAAEAACRAWVALGAYDPDHRLAGNVAAVHLPLLASEGGLRVPIEALDRSLNDPSPRLRARGLEALGAHAESSEARARAVERVEDVVPSVRRRAASLLARWGG